jgi:hypothetical protein
MTIFEQAKARADTSAPPPADRPFTAAATAFGFGLFVIGLFVALEWLGVSDWVSWIGAGLGYGGIAYADCFHGWNRNRREYRDALEELKARSGEPWLH